MKIRGEKSRLTLLSAKKQRGVALVQVLITTAIIMLLTIYFLSVAKSQVTRAAALQDKTLAYLNTYSAKNQVLFGLLTQTKVALLDQGLNFHGKESSINANTVVKIQDLNGLLSLATLNAADSLVKLLAQDLAPDKAKSIGASIIDWIDKDDQRRSQGAEQSDYNAGEHVRNGPVQTFTELAYIKGMTFEAEQLLISNTTFIPTAIFNPMTSPQKLLASYLDDKVKSAKVQELKKTESYNQTAVQELTGIHTDEEVGYLVGPSFRITVSSQVRDSIVSKIYEYNILPHGFEPVVILSQSPGQPLLQEAY